MCCCSPFSRQQHPTPFPRQTLVLLPQQGTPVCRDVCVWHAQGNAHSMDRTPQTYARHAYTPTTAHVTVPKSFRGPVLRQCPPMQGWQMSKAKKALAQTRCTRVVSAQEVRRKGVHSLLPASATPARFGCCHEPPKQGGASTGNKRSRPAHPTAQLMHGTRHHPQHQGAHVPDTHMHAVPHGLCPTPTQAQTQGGD